MNNLQEEKIKKILKSKGVKVKDVLEKVYPQGKGSYYNEVSKRPLSIEFVDSIKKHFNIDLIQELECFDEDDSTLEKILEENQKLKKENEQLQADLKNFTKQLIEILSKKI